MEKVIEFLAIEGEKLNLHLLIVGDGPSRQNLEKLAVDAGVANRFTITGVVDRDMIASYVAAFDVALLPGINDYASPLKLFEYMYMGKAIVAPDQQNIREVLTDDKDALLFDGSDGDAMTAAIRRLSKDAALRNRLSIEAKSTLKNRDFYWSSNARKVVKLATRLMA
jgi:glycosyltransferase involved in cell wall biosynthesis